jgi:hypothetical protein
VTGAVECRDRRGKKWCRHRNYKLTCAEYDELWRRANGRCEICGAREEDTPHGVLFIDHDARVGPRAVRGLLCNRCNCRLHEPERAGPALDRYLAKAWHLTRRKAPTTYPPPRRPTHEEAARLGMKEAGISTYISGPAVRALLAGLAKRGLLVE